MALFISETDGIIEVREETYTFTATHYSWSYYDLANRLTNSHCKKGDKLDRKMDQSSYDWVVLYYVPKIMVYRPTAAEYEDSPECIARMAEFRRMQAEQAKASMDALWARQAENRRLSFAQKCDLMLDETGVSVKALATN